MNGCYHGLALDPDTAFRLRWRRTWPDDDRSREDFVAREGKYYCRIYRDAGGPQSGRWYWTAAKEYCLGTGFADAAREAALAAERAYFEVRQLETSGRDDPLSPLTCPAET